MWSDLDCSSIQGQLITLVVVSLVTLALEALVGHLALKKKIPAASVLGLFVMALVMVSLWGVTRLKRQKQEK